MVSPHNAPNITLNPLICTKKTRGDAPSPNFDSDSGLHDAKRIMAVLKSS